MEIEIFTDETYIDNYIGIGSLFVPTSYKKELTTKLFNLRCLNPQNNNWTIENNNCPNKCKYHNLNNFEIHFKNIDNSISDAKLNICQNWINFVINHNRNVKDKNKLLYFKILYLDLNELGFDVFGINNKDKNNIYNRFYRTCVVGPLKFFFDNNDITVNNFFHDISDDKESHQYFPWYVPNFLKQHTKYTINSDEVKFIDSNHNSCKNDTEKENAQLIQLLDLILRCSNQILFNKSNVYGKKLLASKFYPLFERLWNKPYNKNSHYNYYKSQDVAIFPKKEEGIQMDLFGNKVESYGGFHRDILIKDSNPNCKGGFF